MNYYIGADHGTSALKLLLVDRYEKQYAKFKEIYPTMKDLFKKMVRT